MRPEGHLITSAVMSGVAYSSTGSMELAASLFTGGFLIDLDHYLDYVAVERQRNLSPNRFLDYYLGSRPRRSVLLLHSYELMGVLMFLGYLTGWLALTGYLFGATVHLTLDVYFNGYLLKDPIRFYSFVYRASHAFDNARLLKPQPVPPILQPAEAVPKTSV